MSKADDRACRVRNTESLKMAVRLIWFPRTAMMTDETLIERLSRGGQGDGREQEGYRGKLLSMWRVQDGSLPSCLRERQRQTERERRETERLRPPDRSLS